MDEGSRWFREPGRPKVKFKISKSKSKQFQVEVKIKTSKKYKNKSRTFFFNIKIHTKTIIEGWTYLLRRRTVSTVKQVARYHWLLIILFHHYIVAFHHLILSFLSMVSSVFYTISLSPVLQLHISPNSSTNFKFSKFLDHLQLFTIPPLTSTFQGLDLVFRSIRQGDEGEYVCISEGRLPQVCRWSTLG